MHSALQFAVLPLTNQSTYDDPCLIMYMVGGIWVIYLGERSKCYSLGNVLLGNLVPIHVDVTLIHTT